jgi:hypothetical protein
MAPKSTVAIHFYTLPHQLLSQTDMTSVQPQNYDCPGCNWKPERSFQPECNHGCDALEDVTPKDVTPMQVVKEMFNLASA